MPAYIAYNKITGVISQSGYASDPDVQITEQEDYILSDHPTDGFKVDITSKEFVGCEIETTLMDVVDVIKESDEILNAVIAKITPSVTTWRKQNYQSLLYKSYPPMVDYLDAQVKISSSDTAIISVGEQELAVYNQKCLNVKTRFPKEV